MLDYAEPVTKLIDELQKMPGVGAKSAQRMAFHILRSDRLETDRLIEAIREVKDKIIFCSICNNITDDDPCRYCSSPQRDNRTILIVEDIDMIADYMDMLLSKHGYHISGIVPSGEKKRLNALGTPRHTAEINIIEL
jgi:recombination protein RecR